MLKYSLKCLLVLMMVMVFAGQATAVDDIYRVKAQRQIDKAVDYLRKTQTGNGSWTPDAGPAITALILTGLMDAQNVGHDDPMVKRGIKYVVSQVKYAEDGKFDGIHAGALKNYSTSLCLMALARVNGDAEIAILVGECRKYLRTLQWQIGMIDPKGNKITKDHPYYGGVGYGKHGRPDLSNTQLMIEALHESGSSKSDPAYYRAMIFVQRLQGRTDEGDGNKMVVGGKHLMPNDGGMIYATSVNKGKIGEPESKAGFDEEVTEDGPVTRLRSYGSMTYAGFKSYLYAQLKRDDPRVTDAMKWILGHYTLKYNPGMPKEQSLQGHYYYMMTFAKALKAWGKEELVLKGGKKIKWAHDLIDQLGKMQREDGSWINEASRWMERDPNLVTGYGVLCLTHVLKDD